jgi:hypothetical protein
LEEVKAMKGVLSPNVTEKASFLEGLSDLPTIGLFQLMQSLGFITREHLEELKNDLPEGKVEVVGVMLALVYFLKKGCLHVFWQLVAAKCVGRGSLNFLVRWVRATNEFINQENTA